MRNIIRVALSAALTSAAVACSDSGTSSPNDPDAAVPAGMVVSNALIKPASAASGDARASFAAVSSGVSYISAVAGSFPGAAFVEIRNKTRAAAVKTVAAVDGGFDAVGIDAQTSDELSLTVFTDAGALTPAMVRVPRRRPPEIVRTSPPKGRTDVALNVQILVWFSEPVDPSSVTASSLKLLRNGSRVDGTIRVSADGLSAEFIPANPLEQGATYSLVVDTGIRDLDGDALTESGTSTFTTGNVVAIYGTIAGTILDAFTQAPLNDTARYGLGFSVASTGSPVQSQPFLQGYDPSTGAFASRLPAGKWTLKFSVLHPWTAIFPGLHLYEDKTLAVDVIGGQTTILPNVLLQPHAPMLLVAVETCPWSLPDPPTIQDWWDCDSGYWGGADVQVEVNGVTGSRTENVHFQSVIKSAHYSSPNSWETAPWAAHFNIDVAGDYDVTMVSVVGNWRLVPWQNKVTRIRVDHGVAYAEFDFWAP